MNGDVSVDVDNIEMEIEVPGYEPDRQFKHAWLRQYLAVQCNAVLSARTVVAAKRAATPYWSTKAQWNAHVEDMKVFGIDVSTWFETPTAMQEFIETLI